MKNETVLENEPKTSPTAQKSSQSNIASALKVMENTEAVPGSNRLIVNGGLLGTCLLFLAALLGMQKVDTPLTIAEVAFAIAIPILVWGFVFASCQTGP